MNTGTKNIRKAGKIAQALADNYRLPAVVFYPATSVNGNLWVDIIPPWRKEDPKGWAIEKERQGSTVYWPSKS